MVSSQYLFQTGYLSADVGTDAALIDVSDIKQEIRTTVTRVHSHARIPSWMSASACPLAIVIVDLEGYLRSPRAQCASR